MLRKNVIFGMRFCLALCILLILTGWGGCGTGDTAETPDNGQVQDYFIPHTGPIWEVIYTYKNGACVGWQLLEGNLQVSSGSDCNEAVPEMRAMGVVPGPEPSMGPLFSAGNLRPQATSGSQGILLLADAFTAVDAYDLATGAELASMPVKGNPIDLVYLPGQNTVYAMIYPSFGASPSIAVIDGAKLQITASIALPANTFPICGALSPDGATLYVSNAGSSDLSANPNTSILAIDTASQTVKGSIPLPANQNLFGYYQRLAVSPDATLLYATGSGGYLEAIDTLTLSPVSFIQLAPFLFVESGTPAPHIVFAPDGSAAYVAVLGPNGPLIEVINPDTSQPVNSIQIGSKTSYLSDLALTLNGSTLLALDQSTGITYPVNTTTLTVGKPIPRPGLPGSTDPIVFSGFVIQP